MNNVILLSCYFGKLPSYFSLFLESCSWNPKIDWLIVTDDRSFFNYPQNVKVYYSSLAEIRQRAKEVIGDWISLERPYKLCDFKPTYGLMFADWIHNYKYWGHCDIDIVWGNLQDVLLPLLEKDFLRIFKYGHLTVYRNVDEANTLFKCHYSGLEYKTALKSNISCGFDEDMGTWLLAVENGIKVYHDEICFDLKRPGFEKELQAYNAVNNKKQFFVLNNKHILRYYLNENSEVNSEERAYIHFQQRNLAFDSSQEHSICQFTEHSILSIGGNVNYSDCFKRNVFESLSLINTIKRWCKIYSKVIDYKIFKLKLILTRQLKEN